MSVLPHSKGTVIIDSQILAFKNDSSGNRELGIAALRDCIRSAAIPGSSSLQCQKCCPKTRERLIGSILGWASEHPADTHTLSLLIYGLAGVGKSTLACSCAERIQDVGRLAAAFCFQPDYSPDVFVPTIVYQLTTRYPAYRSLIDALIINDQLILEKSMDVQFRELLLKPLLQLRARGEGVPTGTVIIVDGLNECKSREAQVLLDLVLSSIREQTLPFRWVIFSRPEPHIIGSFLSQASQRIDLSISRDADSDIETYIRSGFAMICMKYGVPPAAAWPPEEIVRQLVAQSAGLFVYAATIIRHLTEGVGGRGPVESLQSVLRMGSREPGSDENPLSALNQFYIRIMEGVPQAVLNDLLLLLHLHISNQSSKQMKLVHTCSMIGLSMAGFYAATAALSSVLRVIVENEIPTGISFYHRSFVDFLSDATGSSPEFCVQGSAIRRSLLERIISNVQLKSIAARAVFPAWSDGQTNAENVHWLVLRELFSLIVEYDGQLEQYSLQKLAQVNWDAITIDASFNFNAGKFIKKIPRTWRSKIITPSHKGLLDIPRHILSSLMPTRIRANVYVMGNGHNRALLVLDEYHNNWLVRS